MEQMPLETELSCFRAKHAELLGKAKGEYVLIQGERVLGTFASKRDALMAGYRELGNKPFLVKQLTEVDDVLEFTSNLIKPE